MKVYPLLVGEFEARDSTSFRGGNPGLTVWYASYVFYIQGASRKIVVDTGFTDPKVCLEEMNHPCRRPKGSSVEDKLAALGVKPAEIDAVVLTHCHWDHIGGLSLFPTAQVFCQRAEVSWSVGPPEWMASAYPRALSHSLPSVKERLIVIDGDYVLEDGIELRLVGTHSPGSQMVEVRGDQHQIIITGDAVLHYANLEKQIPIGTYHSLEAAVAVLKDLRNRMLQDNELVILPSHDPQVAVRYPSGI